VSGALDAVAGEATGRLAHCLATHGNLVVYGHLSGAPCTIPSALLTTKSLNLHGFTLRAAEAGEAPRYLAARYAELAALAVDNPEPVAGTFTLRDIDAALAATGRGRILLRA
jgi:NADPH:quinone reductase-like Zn-dependent oxidoreductase